MAHYDLHSHSTASDGTLSPAELVHRAHEQGVDVLALTDHDGTEGIEAALAAAKTYALQLIAGVEISASWYGATIHIVGLNIDIEHPELQQGLTLLRQHRVDRAYEIACRLEKAGISGALDGARQYASETMLGRLHFARFLVERGYAKNMNEVFRKFMVRNKPGYVAGKWVSLDEAVNWINAAGGQAIIAHPARYKMTTTKLKRLLGDFKALNGMGMEVVSGHQHPHEVKHLASLAREFELLASCGSDFHGPDNPWIELGKLTPMPESCTPIWSAWKH